MISVHVNGRDVELKAPVPLLDYLRELGTDPRAVAVELNGEILARDDFVFHVLQAGDRVEIVRMVGGGCGNPS